MDNDTAETRPAWKRDVALFLSGQTVSLFGSMLVQYAVMWHITLETKSGVALALAAVFGFLPQALVSIFGGVWADRLNRKALIIAADATIAASTLALALLMLAGASDLWLIFLTLAIRSTGAGIQMPAVSALIPQITPTEHLMRVNGINGSIQSAMALLAPAAAGALYATASLTAIFFIDVVTAVVGIGFLLLIAVPTVRNATAEGAGYFTDLVEGVRYIAHHAFVRWLLVLFGVVFLLTVAPSYLTPLMVARTFGDEVWKLTVLEISFSVGMVLGGLVIAVWGGTRNKIVMIVASSVLFGALSVALGLSTNLWVFFAFMFVVGLAVPFFSTPSMTLLQETVEPERQGRVFGFVGIVMAVAMPIGMVVFGPLADQFTVESLLVAAGILMFVVIAVATLVPAGRRAMRAAHAATHPDEAVATDR
ncbi:MFS transporter [Salinibacterium soli]|uniref:MFS transporter n=1 Tax=Antiquaquibacter soli TaxID=3064523 RepID=A0ABT9BKI2_9MICO|nr:MFS transporter [Protaetiibacter sp. WY-16]MDO7881535.1 MFS transporter [Protaetiibacter sp. WY-16]